MGTASSHLEIPTAVEADRLSSARRISKVNPRESECDRLILRAIGNGKRFAECKGLMSARFVDEKKRKGYVVDIDHFEEYEFGILASVTKIKWSDERKPLN